MLFSQYYFLRLSFGIRTAGEVFQRVINNTLNGLDGMRIYIDDVLIWGATQEEHDRRLQAILATAQAVGLTHEKSVFGVKEVQFLGALISTDGIKPDEKLA